MARRTPPTLPPASPPVGHAEMMREVDRLPIPPETAEERAASASLTQSLRTMADRLHAQNLANGVALAQLAATQHGPLADVFAELGRRYSHLLDGTGTQTVLTEGVLAKPRATKPQRPAFRVIEGGPA